MAILSWCEASDGDGCGQIFPHKTQPGICAKCHKLASFQAGSADIKLWQAMPQCKGCGMAWKNLQGEMCGTCETASPAANQVGNCDSSAGTSQVMHDAIETARQAWAVLASVHLQKSPNTSGCPNTLNTTAGLNYAWNGGGQPGSDKIKIAIEVQIKGASKRSNAGDAYGKWIITKSLLTSMNMFVGKCQNCNSSTTQKGATRMVPETGEVEIVWPDDSVKTIKGFLGSDAFSKGWTKKVYKWFLGHFHELAKQQGVSIFSEIVFSEGFLLCEHEMSSAASGELDHGNYYGGAIWLVEP
ncbi:hypothetical protein F5J12DRAFT_783024 [Pisolithus orientalis]|uniref:uncharacterized protein n=1 Tax=Pisolithus orientalis TaxID=936130 RepID=UPI002224C3C2|nr:uncharacterized protein F5J12DRAFT_783024 [Pisolithus orientalis]KAI6006248.1 hypothetical protein F5J12DRAFT_783024 [Pisolithus orientalis]